MKQKVIALLEPYRDKTLSFGCEVIVAGIAKDNPGCEHDVVVDDRKDEHGRIGMGYFGRVHPDDFQEIIGHPLNLQDWLGVLQGKFEPDFVEYIGDELKLLWGNDDGETTTIYFSLTDGQPKTEADYKAFNDIVEVLKT